MSTPAILTLRELAEKYCERQEAEPEAIVRLLEGRRFSAGMPDGWMLLECEQLDSSRLGEYTLLAFGPSNTFKAPPDHPVSPRGLASDMSTVVAVHYFDNDGADK